KKIQSDFTYAIKTYKAKVNDTDENGKTTLHWAAKNKYAFIVKSLIEHGAKVEAADNNDRTALHLAAEQDSETVVEILAKNHVNAPDRNNCTPLFYAAEAAAGHLEVSKTLLKRMKYADDIVDKEKILNLAAKNKQTDVVKHLLEVEAQVDYFHYQPFNHIYFAAKKNYKNVIKLLLEESTIDNLTLHYTAKKEDIEAVKILFENGAKFNSITDEKNRTPLHWAAFEGCESDILYLIRKDKNLVKASDNNNEPAIYESVWNGHIGFFLNQLEKHAENPENPHSKEDKEVISYLYTYTLSKISNLKFELKSNLIIDINEYFKMIQSGIKLLKKADKQVKVDKYNKQYEKSIEKKIDEAYNIAKNQVKSEINKTVGEIDEQIISLIDETRDLISNVEENKLTLEEKQSELRKKLALKKALRILKCIGITISVVGGPVGIAGSVIKKGVNMAGAYISKEDNSILKFEIPSEVRDSLNQMNIIKHLDKILEALGNINSTKLTKIANEVKEEIEKAQEKLKLTGIESDVIQDFNIAIQDTVVAIDLYDRYQNDKKELDAIGNSIKQAENDINLLNLYEKNIYQTIIPMIKGMQEDINNIEKKIDKKSHVHLDLTKWQVQTSLKEIKYTIQQISKGFSAQEIGRYIEKLDEGMTTLINIYDRIQEYYDQINLANYIAHINSPMAIEIDDKDLKNDIDELEKKIKFSIVKGYLKRARSAFKQWAFPFANEYSNVLNSQLDEEDTKSIIKQIDDLHLKVQERNVYVIKEIDNLKYSDFNSENISTQPFFVWENNNYSQEISEFLVGKEIKVKADITKTDSHKCAVKFNEIGIRLKSKDNKIQDEINNELKNFDVYMTHLGDSYYRYSDKFYVIRSNEQYIEYSFEKNKEGKPVRNNRAYERIRNDELMLSPYTTWKIKLKRETKYVDSKNAGFDKLKTYEKKVDLELVGRGLYVDEEGSNDLMVGTYYKEYEYEHKP
ncbi:6910_t:CDS:2, partial [Dentiscutata heterogama]